MRLDTGTAEGLYGIILGPEGVGIIRSALPTTRCTLLLRSLEPGLLWRNAFLTALVVLIALSFFTSLRRSQRRAVRFDPDRPYQVYTRDFDVEIKADDLDAVAAIGIGHPVEQYYKQGITISSPEKLEGTLVQLINRLLRPQL